MWSCSLTSQLCCVTHQPTLNSTWASNRATTGAEAALHPLTLDRIRPSCLLCRTTLMKPGRWLFVSDTKSCSFSFSSSENTQRLHHYCMWRRCTSKAEAREQTSSHKTWRRPPAAASVSLVGGQKFSCFTALITGPKRQQAEPAPQTSMGLSRHDGVLQHWRLGLKCFWKHHLFNVRLHTSPPSLPEP